VKQAAADHATLVALLISLAVGALILVPALALLFGLVLRGRFDEGGDVRSAEPAAAPPPSTRRVLPAALALLAVGLPLALLGDGLLLGIGFVALAGFVVVGVFALLDPALLSGEERRGPRAVRSPRPGVLCCGARRRPVPVGAAPGGRPARRRDGRVPRVGAARRLRRGALGPPGARSRGRGLRRARRASARRAG
jgi:hypothetical protein